VIGHAKCNLFSTVLVFWKPIMASIAIPHAEKPTLQDRIAFCADSGIDAINERLAVLEREWPAGRMVKVTLGVAIVTGFFLAAYRDPLWLLLPLLSGVFLLQYCFFRSSMLTELFHALGFRSGCTIDDERLLLRALRGDFRNLPTVHEVADKDAIHRMEDEGGPAVDDDMDNDRFDAKEAAAIIVGAAR
jgi:hypothetical protein